MHFILKSLFTFAIGYFGCVVLARKIEQGEILQQDFITKTTLIFSIGMLLGQFTAWF